MSERRLIERNAKHLGRRLPDGFTGTGLLAVDPSHPRRIDRYIDYFGNDASRQSKVDRHGHPRTFNVTFTVRPFQLDRSRRLARALATIRLA